MNTTTTPRPPAITLYLSIATDREIEHALSNALGWRPTQQDLDYCRTWNELCGEGYVHPDDQFPRYLQDTELVVTLLQRWFAWEAAKTGAGGVIVQIASESWELFAQGDHPNWEFTAVAPTFCRAAVLCLLKAHGVVVQGESP